MSNISDFLPVVDFSLRKSSIIENAIGNVDISYRVNEAILVSQGSGDLNLIVQSSGEDRKEGLLLIQRNDNFLLTINGDIVDKNKLLTSGLEYVQEGYRFALETTLPFDIKFADSDSRIYVASQSNNILQYDHSFPGDSTKVTYSNKLLSTSGQTSAPRSLDISEDGTRLIVSDISDGTTYQYTLSTPFDVSTGTYDNVSFSDAGIGNAEYSVRFSTDGTKFFTFASTIRQYSLSTPFDIGTASYDSKEYNYEISPANLVGAKGVSFNKEGTKLFVSLNTISRVFQYTLPTPFDISTATIDYSGEESYLVRETGTIYGLGVTEDLRKMFIVDGSTDSILEYKMNTTVVLKVNTFGANVNIRTINQMGEIL